ncbi:MAG: NADH-quinone oxidoreductase subunit L [Legionellaceae bacterium]|nr:NADH-quinone oxidoreductase subunit L [Legionellaceae bacterium]
MSIALLTLLAVILPLCTATVVGFGCRRMAPVTAHSLTIAGVAASLLLSIVVASQVLTNAYPPIDLNWYTWASGAEVFPYAFHIGFLVDHLTVIMMLVVTFVSLLVHIYSIGYMHEDPGYARFFSYISLFTFMMLMLVTANNFLQLFFGWEGVGLVSYLLIGFWYHKESALAGSLKAFLVNRVGDFGFILGIGLLLATVGSLDYATVFQQATQLSTMTVPWLTTSLSAASLICWLLFVGAMGKSAQIPLHVWLPESMEGPTPISALIHAATMVTAGVFMVARLSPVMEYCPDVLNGILIIGATGALFTGLLALVMDDIKRVVAYSTLSQLGYMMVAMGASAYSAGIFHLMTHACFKALLFLAAGSVIMGMHHEQDMKKMGGLWRKMPITYICFLIGNLALCAIPPFAGFYSKDTIIEAAQASHLPAAHYAYYCVALGAMVTALYSFRSLFLTFHGTPRMDKATWNHVHESPAVVWAPLVVLAIPSVILGYILFYPMLFNEPSLLGNSVFVLPAHQVLTVIGEEAHSAWYSACMAWKHPVFWLTLSGIALAWLGYVKVLTLPGLLARKFSWIYKILVCKYGFDRLNDVLFVRGARLLGNIFYTVGDRSIIDGAMVNGTAKIFARMAKVGRGLQSGYLYHYVAGMVAGLFLFFYCLVLR